MPEKCITSGTQQSTGSFSKSIAQLPAEKAHLYFSPSEVVALNKRLYGSLLSVRIWPTQKVCFEKRWFLLTLFQMKAALGGSPHNIGLRQEVLAQVVRRAFELGLFFP